MDEYKIRIIETVVVLFSYFLLRITIQKAIQRVSKVAHQKIKAQVIKKLINLFLLFISLQFVLFIWGVDPSQLIFFISSMLTVLGIALFAQWSILSNITSALIIFFSHPANIGHIITLLDTDRQIEGRITDIEVFFVILETEGGERITIPNNIFMQKIISRKSSA